jgi:RNA polymerase sigma factor (sigma-70 family)
VVKNKSILTRDIERELIQKYQDYNDQEALNKLVQYHTPYIQKLAAKEYNKFGQIVEYEDLIQEGKIGLIKAIKKFDLKRNSFNPTNKLVVTNQALLTYAHNWIIAEMQNLYHHSHSLHIPAHTLRAIQFNIGEQSDEKKRLAKAAMKTESIDYNDSKDSNNNNYNQEINFLNIKTDPTFEEGIMYIFSPEVDEAVNKLSPIEWEIFSIRYGIFNGAPEKTDYIAYKLGIKKHTVEKILKRVKRLLNNSINSKI